MGDQLAEAVAHLPPVRMAEVLAVPGDVQVEGHAAVGPGAAEFVGGDRHRCECGGGLGVQEAEAGLHLARRDRAQAPIVELDHQADRALRGLGRGAHRRLVQDHPELALEIDAVGL